MKKNKLLSILLTLAFLAVVTVPGLAMFGDAADLLEDDINIIDNVVLPLDADPPAAGTFGSESAPFVIQALDDTVNVVLNNVGFHCGSNPISGGQNVNPATYVNKTPVALEQMASDPRLWRLLTNEYECPICGSTVWYSYSNMNEIPDGENMQLRHQRVSNYLLEVIKYVDETRASDAFEGMFTFRLKGVPHTGNDNRPETEEEIEIDADGVARFILVSGFSYTLTEINIPDGYTNMGYIENGKTGVVYSFNTQGNFTSPRVVSWYNDPPLTGSLEIQKVFDPDGDVDAAPPEWNPTFRVFGPSFPNGKDFTWDEFEDDVLVIGDLTPGSYTVEEIDEGIPGYSWDVEYNLEDDSVVVVAGETTTVVITNRYTKDEPEYDLMIRKVVTGNVSSLPKLPEGFYIIVTKEDDEDFIPIDLYVCEAESDEACENEECYYVHNSGNVNVHEWLITGLTEGTYIATEDKYTIVGYNWTGTSSVTVDLTAPAVEYPDVDREDQGNEESAIVTITLTNNYTTSGGDDGGDRDGGGGSGRSGGGGTERTPPTNEDFNIPDPETPLADFPPDEDLMIDEPDVPLSDMPQTGIADITLLLLYGLMASLLGISVVSRLIVVAKKERSAIE